MTQRTLIVMTPAGVAMRSSTGELTLTASEMDALVLAWQQVQEGMREDHFKKQTEYLRRGNRNIWEETTQPEMQIVVRSR